ncbi:uncharacterized protein BORCS6 isoform X2 [Fopius arisanus]|uniref:Uncharacterized protein BORCS6 isoform X2 n=1 Tax=Fopius arisanus TaxID=64838 RepID=A0A9R1U612_9HYME|nr:PREDICTED: uncharacterized protein LOC105269675 isoform X2 [Fopius arisanus]
MTFTFDPFLTFTGKTLLQYLEYTDHWCQMSRSVSTIERDNLCETRMDEEPDVPTPRTIQPQNSYKLAPMDFDEDREMTASYSEISFDSQSSPPISELRSLVESPDIENDEFITDERMKKIDALADRPHMLNLKSGEGSPEEEEYPELPGYRKAMGYLRLEGTVMQEGDMVLFVAEDLENKIKLSSPVTKKGETPSFPGSRSSTPCLYRQALNPQLPLPDHNALNELEMEARKIATSVDSLTENLAAILHSASAVTVDCLETYRDAVCKTCDAVDHNIKSMYQLMAKCEELSKSMGPIYKLADQVKEMKRLLDLFEGAMNL